MDYHEASHIWLNPLWQPMACLSLPDPQDTASPATGAGDFPWNPKGHPDQRNIQELPSFDGKNAGNILNIYIYIYIIIITYDI